MSAARAEIARRAREWERRQHPCMVLGEKLTVLLVAERDRALAEVEEMLEERQTRMASSIVRSAIDEVRRMREELKGGG